MDDGCDGVEKGEGALAGFSGDGLGQVGTGERPSSDDRRVVGKGVDPGWLNGNATNGQRATTRAAR